MSSLVTPIIDPAFKRATGTYLAWKTTTNAAAVGGSTRHPIGFTYIELVRFLYGVRTFRIQATATGTYSTGIPFSMNFSQPFVVGSRNLLGGSIYAGFPSENNLVTYLAPTGASGTLNYDQVFDVSFANMWTMRWQLLGNNSQPEIPSGSIFPSLSGLIYVGLYYPALFSVVAISSMGLHMGLGTTLALGQTLGYGANGGNTAGPFGGTFLGKSFLYYAVNGNVGAGQAFVVTSSSFVITADNYWPYDPGDGDGPLYNATTGAQLRSPFPPL